MFDKNRPDCVQHYKLRYQLSGKTDRESLMKWRCEYRYTSQEIDQIRSGQYNEEHINEEHMTKEHAQKVMTVIHPVIPVFA